MLQQNHVEFCSHILLIILLVCLLLLCTYRISYRFLFQFQHNVLYYNDWVKQIATIYSYIYGCFPLKYNESLYYTLTIGWWHIRHSGVSSTQGHWRKGGYQTYETKILLLGGGDEFARSQGKTFVIYFYIYIHIELHIWNLFCSHSRNSLIPILLNWRKSYVRMTRYILFLNTWKRIYIKWLRTVTHICQNRRSKVYCFR